MFRIVVIDVFKINLIMKKVEIPWGFDILPRNAL